mmetsp:Transcript_13122/g.26974  ORF Transcript_13122/g.26974 Transcript_13122/m.26974 type:complete len:329 (+) Transcript_13122:486-1472(+)
MLPPPRHSHPRPPNLRLDGLLVRIPHRQNRNARSLLHPKNALDRDGQQHSGAVPLGSPREGGDTGRVAAHGLHSRLFRRGGGHSPRGGTGGGHFGFGSDVHDGVHVGVHGKHFGSHVPRLLQAGPVAQFPQRRFARSGDQRMGTTAEEDPIRPGGGVRHGRGGGAREEEIGEHRRRGGADLPRRTDATTASDGVDRHPHREQSPPQFAKRLGSKPAGQLVERLQGSQPTIQPGGRPTRHGRRHRLGPRLSLGAPPPHAPRSARRDRSGRRREEDAFPLGRFGRRSQRGRRSDRPAHQNGLLHPRSLPDVAGLSGIGTRRGTFGGDASR